MTKVSEEGSCGYTTDPFVPLVGCVDITPIVVFVQEGGVEIPERTKEKGFPVLVLRTLPVRYPLLRFKGVTGDPRVERGRVQEIRCHGP